MNVIEVSNLNKSYGSNFTLKDVNLTVENGKVFALLGLNGAGKTTLVKLFLNLLNPDSGEILITGLKSSDALSRNGVVFIPEKFSFFPYYTVKGVIEFFGQMKGFSGKELDQQVQDAMKELSILELQDRKLKTLSKGQLQRVGLCNLMIGDNSLIILDEPFSGLDPIGMRDLKELIKKQKELGKTIFINSHILSEMEQICDEVAIIHKGVIQVKKSISEVLKDYSSLENFFTTIIPRD
jgi:ABC-type multidrug transport system ATPase subunit